MGHGYFVKTGGIASLLPHPKGKELDMQNSAAAAKQPAMHFGSIRCRKPHIMLFGHAEAEQQLRQLADLLRAHAMTSLYIGSKGPVDAREAMHGLDRAEFLFFAPSSASCVRESESEHVEAGVLHSATYGPQPVPVAFVIGARQGLNSELVRAHGSHAVLVVSENADQTGALQDTFPKARLCSMQDVATEVPKEIIRYAKPTLTI